MEKRQANHATASFDSIGFVPAGARRYAFYDREFTRSAYYRLRAVGGETIMSRVVVLEKSGRPEAWGFQLYPNPVAGNEPMELVSVAGQAGELLGTEVLSPAGQRLGTFSGSAGAVNQWLNRLNGSLPSGLYLLRLAEGNRQAVLRWVKQ